MNDRVQLAHARIAQAEETKADFLKHEDSADRRQALAWLDLKIAESRFEIAQAEVNTPSVTNSPEEA